MIKVKNSTIELPGYMAHAAKEIENRKPISAEQKAKNLKCVAKLKAWLRGEVSLNAKPGFSADEKQLTAKDIMAMSLAERQGVAA